jgi:hypothetical protein
MRYGTYIGITIIGWFQYYLKYKNIKQYLIKNKRYGSCDGIRFGFVNGKKHAFLIQNAFPVIEEFIDKFSQNFTIF